MRHLAVAALLLVPQFVQAEAYRCKQPNGTLAFQDHPCQNGATGSIVTLPTVQGYAPSGTARPPKSHRGDETRADNTRIIAENARVAAENKQQRCNAARHELGVLKEQRPVYHRDNDGNRVYMEDKDRAPA